MPLSKSAPRALSHSRDITLRGYEREDGLWDIEAHLIDTKSYSFPNEDRGGIGAGEPLHEMWVRLTIDIDLKVHDAEAVTDASPFTDCPSITPVFKQLIGMSIGPGWNRRIKEMMGGACGCTHLTELLGPMATTAYQTLVRARNEYSGSPNNEAKEPPPYLNTCHMLSTDGPIVAKQWPQFYTGTDKETD